MWILASFTCDGVPATGLVPLVYVRDVETGSLVIDAAPMAEKGDGFYGYEFSAYNPSRDYSIMCDSLTLSGVERYTYASSGEYNEVLDSIESTVSVVDLRTLLLRKIHTNRLELFDGDSDNWILYDDDRVTPLLTFSVSDKDNSIIIQQPHAPSKRDAADGTISGAGGAEIYMRKSVYDPDENGMVGVAENVGDGVYLSTASGVYIAVINTHAPCILGTKCVDEDTIGDGLFVKYNAATDRLEYSYASSSGTGTCEGISGRRTIISGSTYTAVHLPVIMPRNDYVIYANIINDLDITPSIYAHITTDITTSGFVVRYSGDIDSDNYILHWTVASGICGGGSVSGTIYHDDLYNRDLPDQHPSSAISVETITFSGILSSADLDAQTAFETIDQHNHDVRYYTKTEVDLMCTGLYGEEPIINGARYTDVVFDTPLAFANYTVLVNIKNEVDPIPSVYAYTIGATTTSGFTVIYSGDIDSSNYTLVWTASSGSCGGDSYYTKEEINALIGINKSGQTQLGLGDIETQVVFSSPFSSNDYSLFVDLENTTDSPSSEYAITITEKITSGFKVHYSGQMDSNNYYLNWFATSSGINGGNYITEVFEDKSPALGGDLYINSFGLEMDVTPSGNVIHGYTIGYSGEISKMYVDLNDTGVGCPLHMKSNGHWEQCTAASGTTQMPCGALAVEEDTGFKKILWRGIARKGAWSWTPGSIIYVSTIEGALTQVAPSTIGEWKQPVGIAIASDTLRFDPGFYPGTLV